MATPLTSAGSQGHAGLEAPPLSLHLHAQLRKAGLRPTFHRLYVMRVMDTVAPRAVTAEQVFQRLLDMEIAVSQGTVYRALNELEQHDLLVRTRLQDASDNKVRYAVNVPAPASPAYTFSCRVCAKNLVVTDHAFSDQLTRQAQACGFDRQLGTIHIEVTCNQCA